MAGGDDFGDKSWPVVWPFLLQHGYEDEIELVYKGSLALERLFGTGGLDDEVDDEIANT